MTERSEIHFGTTRIPFLIRRSDRRETVALAIEAGKLVVTAPHTATIDRLNALVRGKAFWVKQRLRSADPVQVPEREFVSGESFRYLGRQYRLRVERATKDVALKLDRGWLVAPVADKAERSQVVRDALAGWYRDRAQARLPERVEIWAKRLDIEPPTVLIRDQRRRWGSCNRVGEVRLNWRIIQAPLSVVDYVVAHELVHVLRGDEGHSPVFWAQLGRTMPDYDCRRTVLRLLGPSLEW